MKEISKEKVQVIDSTRMPDADFQNLLKTLKTCFEERNDHKKNYQNKNNEENSFEVVEETSFVDAAKWAMSQKKKT